MGGTNPVLSIKVPRMESAVQVLTDPFALGIYEQEDILFVLYRLQNWSWQRTPYHRTVEERRAQVKLGLLTEQSRVVLQVVFINDQGWIEGIRPLKLGYALSRALWMLVLMQDVQPDLEHRIWRLEQQLNPETMATQAMVEYY